MYPVTNSLCYLAIIGTTPQKKTVSEKLLDAQKELCKTLERTNELIETSIEAQKEFHQELLSTLQTLIQVLRNNSVSDSD